MNHSFLSPLAAALMVALLTGCPSGKVIREDFSTMERIEIPEAGLSFLFVSGAIGPEFRQDDIVFSLLNPVDEFATLGQDPDFRFHLMFRKVESDMVAENVGKGVIISHGEGSPITDLERSLRCANGDLWLLEIEVRRYSIDGHDYFEEDIEVARRILESVECIGDSALAATD